MAVYGELTGNVQGIIAQVSTAGGPCNNTSLFVNISGPPLMYQWQISPDSTTWSDISGATYAPYTPVASGANYYRCHFTTTNSTYDETTPGVKVLASIQGSISGTQAICSGNATTLSDSYTGGVWISNDPAVASVNLSGLVSGISGGTAIISYVWDINCIALDTFTVNQTPASITGTTTTCSGTSTTLSDAITGGIWSSNNTAIATADSNSGVVSGASGGNTTITYTLGGGCYATIPVTITTIPAIATITGNTSVCVGTNTTLSDVTAGGYWFSSSNAIATISATGVVTGVSPGGVVINYTEFNSCGANESFIFLNIVAPPSAISGTGIVCQGSKTTLTDASTGGTWSSSNTAVATVGSGSGTVSGISGGTTTVSYSTAGCYVSSVVTVNPLPNAGSISGAGVVCTGNTISLTDIVSGGGGSGGVWSSGNTSVATVGSTGVVSGLTSGTTAISYTVTNGCGSTSAIAVVTVNSLPGAGTITGTATVCTGNTTNLTDGISGGVWSSGTTAIASVGSTGIVTGVTGGTASISYTVTNSCGSTSTIAVVTVNTLPLTGTITGTATVCSGASTNLTDATGGGVWSSASTGIATVGSTGIVTGVSGGNTIISYTVTGICGSASAISAVTVNTVPVAGTITGVATLCAGTTTNLTDVTGGGVWSSGATGIATIATTGTVTGIGTGTATISYTLTNGCGSSGAAIVVTVNQQPSATITNALAMCNGGSVVLYSTPSGGADTYSWSGPGGYTSTAQNAFVSPTSSTTYSLTVSNSATGCSSGMYTTLVTVNPTPTATVTNSSPICSGGTVSLMATPAGGANAYSWTGPGGFSSTLQNAVATATATGTYSLTVSSSASLSGCNPTWLVYTTTVTVNIGSGSAGTITGLSSVLTGSNITLTDAVSGGAWSASNSNATVSGGTVTGVTAGTVTISYAVTGGCGTLVATKIITVNNATLPGINGAASICAGTTTTLTDATTGGVWSSSNGAVATIGGTTGIVSGLTAGTTNITYTQGVAHATMTLTVTATPLPVQGATSACAGATITLTDNTSGGTWSSSGDVSVVTAGTNSGTVTEGAIAGTGTITYTLADGCYMTYPNTVIANPSAIFGATIVCVGSATVLSDSTVTAVSWTSSNTLVATVNITGHVTGVTGGTVTITYKASSGCIATTIVSVTSTPGAVTGNSPVCPGAVITLSDVSGAGTWSSSNTGIATVGSASGVVTGITGGSATITYFPNTGGCNATVSVTVNAALPITGNMNVCTGTHTTLSDATTGGTWSSNNTAIATIDLSTGIVTGVSVGSTSVTYTLASGCTRTATVNVVGVITPIIGAVKVCASLTTTLSDATIGGTWNSSNTLIATIGSASGLVTASGVNTGAVTISYTTASCVVTSILTINANPMPVQGATSECAGTNITLSDATAGGAWTVTGDASIGTTGILAAGVTQGTATVTYTLATGCFITYPNTVIKNPSAIFGVFTVCAGSVTILSDTTATAVSWTSGNTLVATVLNTGHVTGVAFGTAIITYKALPGNCITTQTVTVNALPSVNPISASITSISHTGTPATLTETTPGGIWSSSNTAKIALSGSTGSPITATAVATSGSSVISYVVTNGFGCAATATVTLTATPAPPNGGSATGIANTDKTNEVLLYPNPTNSAINIKADVAGVFYLYSLDGKSIGAYKIMEGINNLTMPNELATGIYMGRYVGEDGNVALFKVVKE